MSTFEVTSELYSETDFGSTKITNGNTVSKFSFTYPQINLDESDDEENVIEVSDKTNDSIERDTDGDLVVERKKKGVIEIEHLESTKLKLVGLQIWRGALLLADYILHNNRKFRNKKVLELGSGVGLTSIAASFYARDVVCTDIDIGGLMDLIKANVERNSKLVENSSNIEVTELDFTCTNYSKELKDSLKDVDIIIAADVIYDDEITEAFIKTLEKLLLELENLKTIYIALEKRYVFATSELDTCAPMYAHFLKHFERTNSRFGLKRWKMVSVCLGFPQYFDYERVKELVLLKIVK